MTAAFETDVFVDGARLRAHYIARGVVRPGVCDLAGVVTLIPWVDSPPTLRLDDAGKRAAARTIAKPDHSAIDALHRQQPPPEWAARQKDEP